MAALLNAEQRNIDRISFLMDECKKMDIKVLPPDINESDQRFTVSPAGIRFGLAAVKNVGEHIVEELIKERVAHGQFNTIENLLERVRDKDLNKKSLESLIKCGAFDNIEERNLLLSNIDTLLKYSQSQKTMKNSAQISLFADQPMFASSLRLAQAEPVPTKQALAWEKDPLQSATQAR
jgi:DNA polymerase-3 subunit alpha